MNIFFPRKITVFVLILLMIIPVLSACSGDRAGNSSRSSEEKMSKPYNSEKDGGGPLVGIAWSNKTAGTFEAVCEAVRLAGGTPVLLDQVLSADLSYDDNNMLTDSTDEDGVLTPEAARLVRCNTWQGSNVEDVMKDIHAIVVPGGVDISPTLFYEPQPLGTDEALSAERDVSDYLIISYCLEKDIPMLAICRGMQLLSVVSGADMIQDIPTYVQEEGKTYGYEHRNDPEKTGRKGYFVNHDVTVTDRNSILYELTGSDIIHNAPCRHHQAVKSVEGTRLKVTGTIETSGLEFIEAVERPDKTFVLGLQYHPEVEVVRGEDDISLEYFRAVVERAK